MSFHEQVTKLPLLFRVIALFERMAQIKVSRMIPRKIGIRKNSLFYERVNYNSLYKIIFL